MALQTKGFASVAELSRHFQEHGDDFGASNAVEYEESADMFLAGGTPPGVLECTQQKGDKVRYDPNSQALGVLDTSGVIRTYYKPVPCSSLPGSVRQVMKRSGRCHGHANNLVYFKSVCKR